jgi:hypothetical protein
MVYCAMDSVERDDTNANDFDRDEVLGWVHRQGNSWHTVMGTPVRCLEIAGARRFYLVAHSSVPTPAAIRESERG